MQTSSKNASEYQGNPASLGVENLQQQLEKADELFQKGGQKSSCCLCVCLNSLPVKGPSEATLDSHFLLMASNVGAQKARAMKSGTGSFDMDEFITKLRNFMNGGLKPENIPEEDDEIDPDYNTESSKLDWDRIGRLALAKSRRAPALSFMLGFNFDFLKLSIMSYSGLDLFQLSRRCEMLQSVQDKKRTMAQ